MIARSGKPVAELVWHDPQPAVRRGGQWKGKAHISDDFDDPMPEVEELFGT